ncbi:DUF5348 domain-containing protein [Clostridium beijerinckii]|uniref:DUF5348 domain-containing protein n=1 Tax=Clostridium beijerinckii TaxID=1520 RepID=UPI001360D56C|nr:DUF5348 domain-containing protein [Clostridium beijerinckii]MZK53147.1 hypothetical protein [Clostridium beijerinckii]MZK61215.1 hypothetical protein [Clostridium beijerinckii]MZK71414.1 hypothetical protein [Clostridium beijerinckii]MZK76814.1 hypothetical protein [Clostridium beijerinckii]MZK86481.1 hypothetical protein [Clostridium beijerinckii]
MREGYLQHNDQGRYEIPNITYFTSGEPIQLLVNGNWIMGRIEYSHSKGDYYFLNEEERIYIYNLSGIKAREVN